MPWKSEAQRRLFYAMASRGEITQETLERWKRETGDRKLPERVSKDAIKRRRERKMKR